MPRALILGLCYWTLVGVGPGWAQTPEPTWTLRGPSGPVVPGQPFEVAAEVRLPWGWYQDAASDFLKFEPQPPVLVVARAASAPQTRDGKASYTGTFTLTRTLVLPEGAGPLELRFDLGWQICQTDGVCLLPGQQTKTLPVAVVPGGEGWSFWVALGAAFLGGLLLNLMPCVFPVLALKALALASGRTKRERRLSAWAFAAGSASTVFALGLAVAGAAWAGQRLDWGFPFQQPWFVAGLAAVFLLLTLSLLGWLPWAGLPFQPTKPAPSLRGSFGGGALLVLAAAPCTAPLLGPALGFALGRPPAEIPLFFAAIGLGLAAPLLVLGLVPAWARWLPTPGPWLTRIEKGAGLLLGATTLYLLGVLGAQTGWTALVAAAALGAGALVLRIARGRTSPRPWKAVGFLLFLVGLAVVVPAPSPGPSSVRGWAPYSPQALETSLAAGRPVLVDATAAWCATCQVNEAAVLHRADVAAELDRLGVVKLRADYTRPDPAIQAWLASVDRAGLPVYALYRPGRAVFLFPELLTDDNFTRRLAGLVEVP